MNKLQSEKKSTIYKYTLPGFILYFLAMMIPLILCLVISFTSWRGGKKINFIGLNNYVRLLKDDTFWLSFFHNLEFIGILIVSQIGIAFLMSLFFQSKKIYFKEFHRKVIFLPSVLAAMVVAMIWQIVYRSDIGLISSVLQKFGLEGNIPWLSNAKLVIPAICLTLTWQFVGQFVVIIMAGMQNIDGAIVEAAEIDGASAIQRARYITFPLLKPTISICLLICISGCMKMFDIVFGMSGGGPGKSSMVTALYSYNLAFESQKVGYASASAIGMTILSLALVVLFRKLLGGKNDEN
ncbi:carbohydrate ABC transporter permease [Clostridium sp. DL1XJH146]